MVFPGLIFGYHYFRLSALYDLSYRQRRTNDGAPGGWQTHRDQIRDTIHDSDHFFRNLKNRILSDKMAIEFQYYGQVNRSSTFKIVRSGSKKLAGKKATLLQTLLLVYNRVQNK